MTDDTLEGYKTNLSTLIDTIKSFKEDEPLPLSSTSSTSSTSINFDLNIYWMLQDPIDEYKYKNFKNQTKLNNKQIDLYNRASISLL
jgi:hypothetical protein